jgi:hypothetical protein
MAAISMDDDDDEDDDATGAPSATEAEAEADERERDAADERDERAEELGAVTVWNGIWAYMKKARGPEGPLA